MTSPYPIKLGSKVRSRTDYRRIKGMVVDTLPFGEFVVEWELLGGTGKRFRETVLRDELEVYEDYT